MHIGKLVSTCAVVIALTAVAPAPTTAGERNERSTRAAGLSTISIDNFGRLNPQYYRGEQPEGRDYADLAALGVRTVIDLQADGDNHDEEQMVESAGMSFVRIPMTTHAPPTLEQLALFLHIVNDPVRQPVYVHCKGGKHRTGVMTAVYRMERDGWDADQAYDEMKEYKFGWSVLHPEFKKFVYSYKPGHLASVVAAAPAGVVK